MTFRARVHAESEVCVLLIICHMRRRQIVSRYSSDTTVQVSKAHAFNPINISMYGKPTVKHASVADSGTERLTVLVDVLVQRTLREVPGRGLFWDYSSVVQQTPREVRAAAREEASSFTVSQRRFSRPSRGAQTTRESTLRSGNPRAPPLLRLRTPGQTAGDSER